VRVFLLVLLFLLGTFQTEACALTAEEAYEKIPHRRTVFNAGAAKMGAAEREFLTVFFETVDVGVVERVETMSRLMYRNYDRDLNGRYAVLKRRLNGLKIPNKLKPIRKLVVDAVEDQRAFLHEWNEDVQGAGKLSVNSVPSHPRVRSASTKLKNAYGKLMKLYPQEGQHNKEAFFDYLCALDFV